MEINGSGQKGDGKKWAKHREGKGDSFKTVKDRRSRAHRRKEGEGRLIF